jgi:hypothetical protein
MFEFACDLSPTIHNFSFVRLTSGLGDSVFLGFLVNARPVSLVGKKGR